MSTQLKTMTEEQLLEKVGKCSSIADIKAIKAVAKEETSGQSEETTECIFKVIYACQDQIKNSNFDKLLSERKDDFYECAMYFNKQNDLLNMGDTIEKIVLGCDQASERHKEDVIKIKRVCDELRTFWSRYHFHVQDISELKSKYASNEHPD